MTDLTDELLEQGIRLRSYSGGEQATTGPRCSPQRKKLNQKKPCLSVKIDDDGAGATWCCHHCNWSDNIATVEHPPREPAN